MDAAVAAAGRFTDNGRPERSVPMPPIGRPCGGRMDEEAEDEEVEDELASSMHAPPPPIIMD